MATSITDYRKLTGVEKAAAFMLTLSEEQIGKIFKLMDEDEIKDLSFAMSQFGKVEAPIVDRLYKEIGQQVQTSGTPVGSFETTEKLLQKVLTKEKAQGIMEEIRGPAGRTMWDKLGNVSEDLLANYLKNEYPQTIAVVLSRIRTEHASKVLSLLPDNLSMEVVLRMLRMESVRKEILEDLEKTLRSEFMSSISRSNKRDPYALIADIFNFFDRQTEARFMSSLEERNPEASDRVKALMFTFDDLIRLEGSAFQEIIRAADKTKLCLALKGSNDGLKELFFKNMSERAAKIMKEDMGSLGMVRVKDVDEAQGYIVKVTKDLGNQGIINIHKGNDQDEAMIG